MRIYVTRHGSGHYREVVQTPLWEADRFADADAAIDALLAYGRAIIDGEVPGIDVSVLKL